MGTKPKHPKVHVGVQGAAASADHEGVTNAMLAAVHEFGTTIKHPGGTPYRIGSDGMAVFLPKGAAGATGVTKPHDIVIPERSFIRSTIDENRDEYRKEIKRLAALVLDGKLTEEKALAIFGLRVEGDIQARIQGGIAPPLKAATIKRKTVAGKKGTTPLIGSGQLVASITSEVQP